MKFERHIPLRDEHLHRDRLVRGLRVLGSAYIAHLCWWCHGYGIKNFRSCDQCGTGNFDGLGLMQGNRPAPHSVVNQVLEAAERSVEIPLFDEGKTE